LEYNANKDYSSSYDDINGFMNSSHSVADMKKESMVKRYIPICFGAKIMINLFN